MAKKTKIVRSIKLRQFDGFLSTYCTTTTVLYFSTTRTTRMVASVEPSITGCCIAKPRVGLQQAYYCACFTCRVRLRKKFDSPTPDKNGPSCDTQGPKWARQATAYDCPGEKTPLSLPRNYEVHSGQMLPITQRKMCSRKARVAISCVSRFIFGAANRSWCYLFSKRSRPWRRAITRWPLLRGLSMGCASPSISRCVNSSFVQGQPRRFTSTSA